MAHTINRLSSVYLFLLLSVELGLAFSQINVAGFHATKTMSYCARFRKKDMFSRSITIFKKIAFHEQLYFMKSFNHSSVTLWAVCPL